MTCQALSALDEALPLALIEAYARELQLPVTIAGRSEAARKVSAILSQHGESLTLVLDSLDDGARPRPVFPGDETGVTEAFVYLGHFLPLAAIVLVVEGIFPITLWLFTYFTLVARVARDEQGEDADTASETFGALVSLAPVTPIPEPARRPGRPRKNGQAGKSNSGA